jgi:hypothetical protein
VFLVNSHNPRFSATSQRSEGKPLHADRHTFSRSYGVILPSSLTRVLSRALGYSPRPPESVCGTDTKVALYAAFLGSLGSPSVPDQVRTSSPLGNTSYRLSLSGPSSSSYGLERTHPCGALGLPFSVPAYFNPLHGGAGILTCFPSPTPLGLGLGTD